ncbi:MAG: UxaA family hydrolase, partial [Alphaproteobacteria bacterium]|nr:UxaA family hydrolase [Alphaproteobacteria bacterium]
MFWENTAMSTALSATPPIFLRLNAADNVVVARADILPGTPVEAVTTGAAVPAGHKIATVAIAEGEPVRKYNQIIGFASRAIAPGDHVHEHNCAMADFARDYAIGQDAREVNFLAAHERATFQGYRRANGRVGTRNYLGVLTSVNCSASAA